MKTSLLELKDVCVTRGGVSILLDVNLENFSDEHWVILGANGCGKTSLISAVLGYLWPSSGSIRLLGERIGDTDLSLLRRQVVLVSDSTQRLYAAHLTGYDVLLTGLRGHYAVWHSATEDEICAIQSLTFSYDLKVLLPKKLMTMSTGERQRILIARAVLAAPKILILDEPYAGLDMIGREQVRSMVDRVASATGGPNLILVTHHLEEISPVFNRVALMKKGSIIRTGCPEDLLNGETLSNLFEFPLKVETVNGRRIAFGA